MENSARRTAAASNTNLSYFIKLFLVTIFLTMDVIVNGWCEFTKDIQDGGNNDHSRSSTRRRIDVALFVIQILMQLSSFTLVILLMCDTLPFRVGLVHIFFKRFGYMIVTLGVYLFLTMMVGGMRLSNISDKNGKTMVDLWNTGYYSFFSICQKLVAPFHYAFILKSVLELGMSEYFSKENWLNGNNGHGLYEEDT